MAAAFAPEVVEMEWRLENVQQGWGCRTLAISASAALLKDIQDLYAKKGYKEYSKRDAFDRPHGSDRLFLDAGKLHVRAVGGGYWDYLDRVLRPCLAALAARGLAPAEPAALAALAAGPEAATEADLREVNNRVWQRGGHRSLWLPLAPPARPAGGTPAGEAILHISAGSVLADVQRLFNCAALPPDCSHSILLAWVVPALERSGYELVAPKRLAEHAKSLTEQGTDFDTQFQQLSSMGIQAPLVFVEQARLTSEQPCIDDARPVEDCSSAGDVTIQISANGVVSLFDAPREARLAIEEAHPWVCSDTASQLHGLSLEFSPKLIDVLLASVTSLGYEQVAAPGEPVGAYRFSQPSRPAVQPQEASSVVEQAPQADSEELAASTQAQANAQHALPAELEALSEEVTSSMEACRAEFEAKLCAQEESSRQATEALRAELVEALHEQRNDARAQQQASLEALEAVRSQAEELQAQLQAQGEECARLVEEQRLLRNELEKAHATQQSSHEATRLVDEQGAAEAQNWPAVHMYDAGTGTADSAKHIRIACPGAGLGEIAIEELNNGVHVRIAASDQWRVEFDREICFDRHKDGFFELRLNECLYENGILLLVLKQTSPKRIQLTSSGGLSAHRSSLANALGEAPAIAKNFWKLHQEANHNPVIEKRQAPAIAKNFWELHEEANHNPVIEKCQAPAIAKNFWELHEEANHNPVIEKCQVLRIELTSQTSDVGCYPGQEGGRPKQATLQGRDADVAASGSGNAAAMKGASA